MAHNIAQHNNPGGKKTVAIRIELPIELDGPLDTFKDACGYKSKAVAIVKIVQARLFPALNGDKEQGLQNV